MGLSFMHSVHFPKAFRNDVGERIEILSTWISEKWERSEGSFLIMFMMAILVTPKEKQVCYKYELSKLWQNKNLKL